MIIWGSQTIGRTLEQSGFFCPICRREEKCDLRKERRFFTLYFIPLFPISGARRCIRCHCCGNSFSEAILCKAPAFAPLKCPPEGANDNSSPWRPGDRVLAYWAPDLFWYPAVVAACSQGKVLVHFDDGDTAVLPPDRMVRMDVGLGTRVFARWNGGPYYHPAHVQDIDDENVLLFFDDGRTENSTISRIRLLR
jgi:hypothetical protein